MAQQTATTAVGLELGSEDGLDGTIGFDGTRSRCATQRDDRFPSRAKRASDDHKGDIAIAPIGPDPRRAALPESPKS